MSDEDGQPETEKVDVAALEERVRIAELLARQAEAELRYLKALADRKDMKTGKKDAEPGDRKNARKIERKAKRKALAAEKTEA